MTILLHVVTGEIVLDSGFLEVKMRGGSSKVPAFTAGFYVGGFGDVVEVDVLGDIGRALGREEDL